MDADVSCCRDHGTPTSPRACPVSRSTGTAVDLQTVKALLTTAALQRLEPGPYRFCPAPDCDVVYFDDHGRTFSTGDISVEVWQKRPAGDRIICYCFGENEGDMRHELESTGRSPAVERVRAHIKAGRCACEVRNPRGTCCLGDVTAAIERVQSEIVAGI